MATFINSKFKNINQILDGNVFKGCIFNECTLEYHGEADVGLIDCKFYNCRWVLKGAAGRTVDFLRAMNNGFGPVGKKMIDDIFNRDYISPNLPDEQKNIHPGKKP
jgi:hypothetical protein